MGASTLTALALLLSTGPRLSTRTATAAPARATPQTRWKLGELPASIRNRLHLSAASVPPFPMEDPRLLKPKNWPETMVIAGVRCARRIHAWEDDDAFALASLGDLEPGDRLTLFYDHESTRWNSANAGWGPRYSWDEKKRLAQRVWYEPDSARLATHDYTYYKDGRLLGYSVRNEPRKQPHGSAKTYEFLSQFFDRDGRLIALGFERMHPGSRDSLYAWMGTTMPYDTFRMKTHAFYSNAHPGNR
jgi:hypothetical protein